VKISAKDIERWAETREAQGELPRFIRRLAVPTGTLTVMAFLAGESVSRPGWDGQMSRYFRSRHSAERDPEPTISGAVDRCARG